MKAIIAAIFLAACWMRPTEASDWPRFRGPEGNGISRETGLQRDWPTGGPRCVWSVNLNPGYSGGSVRDGAVYVMDRASRTEESMICIDLRSGTERWRHTYAARERMTGFDGSRLQPAVDTNLAFSVGPVGHILALDRRTGQPVWTRNLYRDFLLPDLPQDLRHNRPGWGYSQCPVLYNDMVIVAPYAIQAGLVALDKATGRVLWQSGNIGVNVYSFVSPELVSLGGVDQILTVGLRDGFKNPPAVLSSVSAAEGTVLWQTCTRRPYNVPVPQPVAIGSNTVFYTGGYRIGAFTLEARRTDDGWEVSPILSSDSNCTSHIQTPILYNGHIYAQSFDAFHNPTNHGMVCLNADMTIRWTSGAHGVLFDSGPFLIADGTIFVLHGRTGELFMLDADPDRFNVLARAKVLDARGGNAWTPMSLADGMLLVRDQTTLKCLDVAARKPEPASGGVTE